MSTRPDRAPSVLRFFALTFLITWGLQVPGVLAQDGLLPGPVAAYMPFVMLGVLGPLAAATWLSAREGGWTAVRALYAPLLKWRVNPLWYAAGLLLPGVLLSAALLMLRQAGWTGPILFLPPLGMVIGALVISVGEEVGWRGYALPRLQKRYGAFGASGLIAVAWTLWHIPMFVGQGVPLSLLLVMLLLFMGGSLMFTWIYNGTGGSLLLVTLAHLGSHLNKSSAALPEHVLPLVVHAVIYAAVGYTVLAPRLLRSGRSNRLISL